MCQVCESGDTRAARILSVQAQVEGQPEKWKLIKNGSATFTFNATATVERCTPKFEWNLGDGTVVPGKNVSHSYGTVGEYTVTLTVSCESCPTVQAQTRTVKVAALEIDSRTVATTPVNQTRTKVGVGEEVDLTTAPSLRVTWSFDGGVLSTPADSAIFQAGATARTSKVTIAAPPRLDPVEALTFTVVAPNLIMMRRVGVVSIPAGTMGAGMLLEMTLHPKDVSFYNIEVREADNPATNVTGYFLAFAPDQPPPGGIFHQPAAGFSGVGQDNVLERHDRASADGFAPSRTSPRIEWDSGGFNWLIPTRYRVKGSTTDHPIVHVLQTIRLVGPEGKVTITKGGACVSRTPDNTLLPCTTIP